LEERKEESVERGSVGARQLRGGVSEKRNADYLKGKIIAREWRNGVGTKYLHP